MITFILVCIGLLSAGIGLSFFFYPPCGEYSRPTQRTFPNIKSFINYVKTEPLPDDHWQQRPDPVQLQRQLTQAESDIGELTEKLASLSKLENKQ